MNQINPIIVELLAKRGIRGEAEINEFLSEKPQKTYDPFLLPDMEAGVDLLLQAIHGGKKICIYGDYDADGITSVSILMEFLGALTQKIEYYIPSRFDEGYGLNSGAIRNIFGGPICRERQSTGRLIWWRQGRSRMWFLCWMRTGLW